MSAVVVYAPVPAGTHPDNDSPDYGSTALRHPKQPKIQIPPSSTEALGPKIHAVRFDEEITDLTRNGGDHAIGERIVVHGRVFDTEGRPLVGAPIEIWQANAAGRYVHIGDDHQAPLDPAFRGVGRMRTDQAGRYRFLTVRPGAYPWRNHWNAWRPAHVHFSIFGDCSLSRLITQMYFPGDPLLELDPIFQSIPDPLARQRLISAFDLGATVPEWALAYRFDIVLRGARATPIEPGR